MRRFLLSVIVTFSITFTVSAQWEPLTSLNTSENLYDVYFLNQTTGYVVGTNSIYKTTDSGQNWSQQTQAVGDTRYYGVKFLDELNGWAVGKKATASTAGRVHFTTDGGVTWQVYLTGGSLPWWSVDFANNSQGVIVGQEGQILYTSDGGVNWNNRTSPSGDAGVIRDVVFHDGLNGIAVGYSTPSVGFIMKTTDGGNSWVNIETNLSGGLNGLSFKDSLVGVAVGSSGSIFRTEDGGNSWTQITSNTTQSLRDVDINGTNAIAVGFSGTILKSTNSGLDWLIDQSNTTGALRGVSQNSSTTAFAVGSLGEAHSYCNECNSMKVFNIDYQETEIAELEMEDLSIASDNSISTKFQYSGSDFQDVILRIKQDVNTTNTDIWGSFNSGTINAENKEFLYTHPEYFDLISEKLKDATIEVYNNSTNEVVIEYPFKMVRPSVLLVHGLWGDVKTFSPFKNMLLSANMYENDQIKIVIYTNDTPNSINVYSLIRDKNLLRNTSIENNISGGKFDVLAHSNGGLLSRLYIQSVDNYKEDINKLITFNTPHSGSQFADLLLDPEFAFLTPIMASLGKKVNNGLVNDLKVEGNFIDNLRIIEINNPSDVSLHALTSTYDVGLFESIGIQNWWNSTVSKAGQKHLKMNGVDNFLNDLFNNSDNDLVVPLESQKGGLNNNNQTTNTTNQWHLDSTNNSNMENDAIDLLNSNPNDVNKFKIGGFQPEILNYDLSLGTYVNSTSAPSNESISITNPVEATEYNAGDIVTIEVNGSTGIEDIMSTMGNSIIPLQNHIVENSSADNFTFTIPDNALGRLEIVSLGFDINGYADFDSTYIIVNTDAVLLSIDIVQNLIYVPEGRQSPITIFGNYDDGETREITYIEALTYVFDNQNAEIVENGLVNGLVEGEDILTVSLGSITTSVPVTVANASEWVEVTLSNPELLTQDKTTLVYPNPTSGIVNVNISDTVNEAKIVVYDTTGKIIISKVLLDRLNQIDISKLNGGVYFIKIETNQNSVIKRIIKI